MIPKSVSGTSLILALGAVLTWPVWGWAGEPIVTGGSVQFIDKDPENGCVGYKKDGKYAVTCPTSCDRRMREAMQAVNPYIVDIQNPFRFRSDWAASEIIEHNQAAIKQWNTVMQECVEGGK